MKSLFESKTFWFNIVSALAAILALPEFQSIFGPDALRYMVIAQSFINIVLRMLSKDAVSLTGK